MRDAIRVVPTVAALAWLVLATRPAVADPIIRNLGVDVEGDISSPVFLQDGFYGGDPTGPTFHSTLTIPVLNPGGVFGPGANGGSALSKVTLFVDAFGVDPGDQFEVSLMLDNTTIGILGLLQNNTDAPLPLETGGMTGPMPGQEDNTFFTITDPKLLSALAGSSVVTFFFSNQSIDVPRPNLPANTAADDRVGIAGINLQGELLTVPEPGSGILLATGLTVVLGAVRRRSAPRP